MKTMINKLKRHEGNIPVCKLFFIILITLSVTVIISASTPVQYNDFQGRDSLKNKKLDLLQKLESGKQITQEDIRSSFDNQASEDLISLEYDFPEVSDIEFFQHQYSFAGSDIYDNLNDINIQIPDLEIRINHKDLSKCLEELRSEMESFSKSEEFLNMKEDLKKCSEEFKKDIKKMKEDIMRSHQEKSGKGALHTIVED
jgi:hypothetical protein